MARMTTCPDCRAEISKQAKSCPKCGRPTKAKGRYGCGSVILGSIVAAFVVAAFVREPGDGPAPAAVPVAAPQPRGPKVGDAVIMAPAEGAWVGHDDVYDLMTSAHEARRIDQLEELRKAGKVAYVSPHARAVVTELGAFSVKVKVIDGVSEGFEGWARKGDVVTVP